jgi:thioredoxin 1
MSQYIKYSDLIKQVDSDIPPVLSIKSAQHKEEIIQSYHVVVVDIYGKWCGPCKAIAPKYEQMAQTYGSPQMCILVNEDVEESITEGIRGVPMFQFFVDGELHSSITGADIKGVEERLIELLN